MDAALGEVVVVGGEACSLAKRDRLEEALGSREASEGRSSRGATRTEGGLVVVVV